jgi:hypothetical protein
MLDRAHRAPFAAVLLALFASAFIGTAAAAAAPAELKLDPVSGTAMPTAGGEIELNLVCSGNGKQDCKGRVELLARGSADELESVLAGDPVAVDVGEEADPRFALSEEAREYLRDSGALPVTIVIRQPDGSTASRQSVIAEAKPVPIGPPTVSNRGGASSSAVEEENTLTYTWSKKLRWGTAAVMGDFRCPASHPFVARGNPAGYYGWSGDVQLSASAGVGYAAFDDVVAKPFWDREFLGGHRAWTMTGWYEGGLFRNSIWAPAFEDGSFRLSVTCTNRPILEEHRDFPPAYLYQERFQVTPSVSTFMPWVRGASAS